MSARAAELSAETLGPRLEGCALGSPLQVFDTVESTNTVLHRLAAQDAPAGAVVLADEQTAGRGRLGRAWHSPAGGGLWFSILLRPRAREGAAWGATAAAAAGVVDGVRATTGLTPSIKWPNDLVLDGRKVCGILTETRARADGGLDVIVGVGLNVNLRAEDLPASVRGLATSLREVVGGPVDRASLFVAVLRGIARWVAALEADGVAPLLVAWRASSATLGRRVRVDAGGRVFEGVAEDLEDSGALRVRSDGGEIETVTTGDVRILEPAP